MAAPDIPAAKRAGLPVDLDRLTSEGDGWLTPEDRYALKTHGVCTQSQPGVFMVRVRVPGGVLLTAQAHGLARLARRFGPDWLHLTTRQSVEFHWVRRSTGAGAAGRDRAARSEHQVGVWAHAAQRRCAPRTPALGLDEPFDCFADARQLSRHDRRPFRRAQRHAPEPGQHRRSAAPPAAPRTPGSTTSASSRRSSTASPATSCGSADQPRQGASTGGPGRAVHRPTPGARRRWRR